MKIRHAPPLVALVLAACAQPADLVAPAEEASAPNHGVVTSGGPDAHRIDGFGHQGSGNTIRTFSLSAAVGVDGSVSGSFELNARASDVRLHGAITCATVFGRAAWLGGTITTPGAFEGQDAVFRAVDLGAGTKGEYEDLLSFLRPLPPGSAQDYCDSTPPDPPFFGAQGNITIMSPGQTSYSAVETIEWVDVPVLIPCALDGAGEVVLLSGNFLNLFHITEDPAGGTTIKYQFNPQDVSGLGQVSGDVYQGTGGSGGHVMYTISGLPYTGSFVENFRIIGQGPGNDLLVQVHGQFTVSASGDVTVSKFEIRESCRTGSPGSAPMAFVSHRYPGAASNPLMKIDPELRMAVDTADVPMLAGELAFGPDDETLFVPTNPGQPGDLSVVDVADFDAPFAAIGVGATPIYAAGLPDGREVYVGNVGSRSVTVVDAASNTAVATIGVAGLPRGLEATPDGSEVWVSLGDDCPGRIDIIDTSAKVVVESIAPGRCTGGDIAFTPDGATAYVADGRFSEVLVIDVATRITTGIVGGLFAPRDVVVSPDGRRVYVTNYSTDGGIGVISTTDVPNRLETTIPIGGGRAPQSIAVSPNGAYVMATSPSTDEVVVVDAAANVFVDVISVGRQPFDIAFTR